MPMAAWHLTAAEPNAVAAAPALDEKQPDPRFNVRGYVVSGNVPIDTNTLNAILSRHTGTNVDVKEIVRAAADVQAENQRRGNPEVSVAIMPAQIIDGVVTLNAFQAAQPQILISGIRYLETGEPAEEAANAPAPANGEEAATNAAPVKLMPLVPANPEEMAKAHAALLAKLAEPEDGRIHVVSTNAGPRFEVKKYLVMGNSVLSPEIIGKTFTNIDGAFGTNVSFDGIRTVLTQLQGDYRERGYVTVSVGLPQQKLTNATVKLQVTEGRLAIIDVKGNRYFSSNNVMRALPSLHTNMILNGPIFNAELNRANANQDRQIYPIIDPGPDPGTSALTLKVKDQLPLHGKVEFNNESSPGTPDLRIDTSAVYDNLWQLEHSFGFQYGFSPQQFKTGSQWKFYDSPLVANYSGFYRLPLGNPESVSDVVAGNPGNFGYDEATRQFNLPPPSGRPELNVYASRSTIDTGVTPSPETPIAQTPSISINQQNFQEDLTVDEDEGARLSLPLPSAENFQSGFSGGPDFKTYDFRSYKTNAFYFTIITFRGPVEVPITSTDLSPVPVTHRPLQYLPLSLNYNATWRAPGTTVNFGMGASGNTWFSGSTSNLQAISESTKTTGHWVTLTPSLAMDFVEQPNWILSLKANGQWASEPLISNEQFGAGGVNSVRGYREGEVFGDFGWRVSIEQHTPTHVVGTVFGNTLMTIRGSVYMDAAEAYLMDPQGRQSGVELWSTGVGLTGAIGTHWEARLLFSVPLIGTTTTTCYQPFFNFNLTAQF
jgi:hemolysin activation/secretion protein